MKLKICLALDHVISFQNMYHLMDLSNWLFQVLSNYGQISGRQIG